MRAAPTMKELERRAALFGRARTLIALGVIVAGIAAVGASMDARRARESDGAIRVLERQTAAAQKERHTAAVAAIAARVELVRAKHAADSLERIAAATEARSAQLGRFVRIASETSLVVQFTPDSASVVSVPRIVTQYVTSLIATIADKDRALAARDTQTVRADTVIVVQDRLVVADSTVITSQGSTITEEKRARPRLGFKSGVAVATVLALIIKVVF